MHMETNFMLKRCGLTAEQVRNSPLIRRVTKPNPVDPALRAQRKQAKANFRERNVALGLTADGHVRKTCPHPELRGLTRRMYLKRLRAKGA